MDTERRVSLCEGGGGGREKEGEERRERREGRGGRGEEGGGKVLLDIQFYACPT